MDNVAETPLKKAAPLPSAGDLKFFSTIFKFLPKSLDMNWDEFAKEMGLKDATIAKARFSQIRRKFEVGKLPGTPSPDSSKVTKSTKARKPRKGKGAVKDTAQDPIEGEDDMDIKDEAKKEEEQNDDKSFLGMSPTSTA
ncbi:hypothetical protein AAE478_005965 [Parahypoxylon ruwenzoriense]